MRIANAIRHRAARSVICLLATITLAGCGSSARLP